MRKFFKHVHVNLLFKDVTWNYINAVNACYSVESSHKNQTIENIVSYLLGPQQDCWTKISRRQWESSSCSLLPFGVMFFLSLQVTFPTVPIWLHSTRDQLTAIFLATCSEHVVEPNRRYHASVKFCLINIQPCATTQENRAPLASDLNCVCIYANTIVS